MKISSISWVLGVESVFFFVGFLSMGLNLGREKKIEVGVSERVFRGVWGVRFLLGEICEAFESSAVAWILAGFWEWVEFCTG